MKMLRALSGASDEAANNVNNDVVLVILHLLKKALLVNYLTSIIYLVMLVIT
ncbi:Uncharacterised protein [Salmonella enterica subsp. enterica serovar Daytona]|uniref:Uncharacterized protein n=1 Tax=Salmonella enterica subsp. enterica serovar Daytona TaxID=1962639 RepID=A0A447JI03_SALET|nr:Uncharacterised protein [Salmonella enterica subsp. enterica serovar Daytona]